MEGPPPCHVICDLPIINFSAAGAKDLGLKHETLTAGHLQH
jgi:hypothetical protein